MDLLLTALLSLLIFGLLVFVHEFGHFIVAIKSGVDVEEFAFGFGPKLFSKHRKGVLYRINLIPLGGYVKMLGDMDGSSFMRHDSTPQNAENLKFVKEILAKKHLDSPDAKYSKVLKYIESLKSQLSETDYKKLEDYVVYDFIPNHPRNFDNKSFLTRLAILLAGVSMNFLLGSIMFYIMFLFTGFTADLTKIGEPNFLGAETSRFPVIFQVYKPEYEPYEGAIIQKINGQTIVTEEQFISLLKANYDVPLELELQTAEGLTSATMILTGEGLNTNFDDEVKNKVLLLNIAENSAAAQASVEERSVVTEFAGNPLGSPDELRDLLDEFRGEEVEMSFFDPTGTETTTMLNLPDPEGGEPILGAVPVVNSPFFEGAIRVNYLNNKVLSGFLHSTNLIVYNATALGEFTRQAFRERSIDPVFSQVSSIVAVVDVTHYFVQGNNFLSILNLTAMLSVVLAFMNILPIPLFDGGHILFLFIEKIRGKKISTDTQNKIGKVVFVLLIILTVAIILKDIMQFDWPSRIVNAVKGMTN